MQKLMMVAVILVAVALVASAQENGKPESKRADSKQAESVPSEPRPVSYYRLDFAINELEDGKKVNSRSYTTILEAPERGFFKVGSRVPVSDSRGDFNYLDVGVNFDFIRISERDGLLLVNLSGDVSSIAAPEQGTPTGRPVLRSARFGGGSAVVPGKPTVLYSLDDVNSKHRFQIELTATKLK